MGAEEIEQVVRDEREWVEWGVRRTWGLAVGTVARMSRSEAEVTAREWPGDLVCRVVRADDWTTPDKETS